MRRLESVGMRDAADTSAGASAMNNCTMTSLPRRITQALDDADAAVERHIRGRLDEDEARRGINETLDAIYRAYASLQGRKGFFEAACANVDGATLLGLMYVRGKSTHALVEAHEAEILVPTEDLYPSPDLYTDLNYSWLIWPELEPLVIPRKSERDRRPEVEQHLAGRLVVQGLRRAIRQLRWSLENLPDESQLS